MRERKAYRTYGETYMVNAVYGGSVTNGLQFFCSLLSGKERKRKGKERVGIVWGLSSGGVMRDDEGDGLDWLVGSLVGR